MMGKYVAPVLSALVVIALAAAYGAFFFLVLNEADMEGAVKYIIAAVVLFVIVGVAIALVSRIRELRRGQENDIGKY